MHKFEELNVWKLSIELAKDVYILVSQLPKEEKFGLADQLRRCSVSIPSNIAEGAGRNNSKEFIHFIGISNGSCCELYTQIILVKELKLVIDFDFNALLSQIKVIQNMLYKLKDSLISKKETT